MLESGRVDRSVFFRSLDVGNTADDVAEAWIALTEDGLQSSSHSCPWESSRRECRVRLSCLHETRAGILNLRVPTRNVNRQTHNTQLPQLRAFSLSLFQEGDLRVGFVP